MLCKVTRCILPIQVSWAKKLAMSFGLLTQCVVPRRDCYWSSSLWARNLCLSGADQHFSFSLFCFVCLFIVVYLVFTIFGGYLLLTTHTEHNMLVPKNALPRPQTSLSEHDLVWSINVWVMSEESKTVTYHECARPYFQYSFTCRRWSKLGSPYFAVK